MANEREHTGKCLCGAVSFRATPEPHAHACHCDMCRRWGGGPLMGMNCGTEVAFEGGPITRFRSSDWAERGFCPTCGTHLFYYMISQRSYFMPAGLFEDQSGLDFASEIYVDRKPGWYKFAGERKRQTEAEFLASLKTGGWS